MILVCCQPAAWHLASTCCRQPALHTQLPLSHPFGFLIHPFVPCNPLMTQCPSQDDLNTRVFVLHSHNLLMKSLHQVFPWDGPPMTRSAQCGLTVKTYYEGP